MTTAATEDDDIREVRFKMTPGLAEQVDRIKALTDLTDDRDVFNRSFSVFRLVIDAVHEGKRVEIHDPEHPNDKRMIIPPFKVKRKR